LSRAHPGIPLIACSPALYCPLYYTSIEISRQHHVFNRKPRNAKHPDPVQVGELVFAVARTHALTAPTPTGAASGGGRGVVVSGQLQRRTCVSLS
jgi:hypothetical protein